jgi:hypothetical protein
MPILRLTFAKTIMPEIAWSVTTLVAAEWRSHEAALGSPWRPRGVRRLDHAFLAEANSLIHTKCLTSAKAFLAMRGSGIRPVCRAAEHRLDADDECALRGLPVSCHMLYGEVGILPCTV